MVDQYPRSPKHAAHSIWAHAGDSTWIWTLAQISVDFGCAHQRTPKVLCAPKSYLNWFISIQSKKSWKCTARSWKKQQRVRWTAAVNNAWVSTTKCLYCAHTTPAERSYSEKNLFWVNYRSYIKNYEASIKKYSHSHIQRESWNGLNHICNMNYDLLAHSNENVFVGWLSGESPT